MDDNIQTSELLKEENIPCNNKEITSLYVCNMSDDYNELNYSDEYYICMQNDFIMGRQHMTLREAKLIRLLISQISQKADKFETYHTSIKALADSLGSSRSSMYRDIFNLCCNLQSRVILIRPLKDEDIDNGKARWKTLNLISRCEYDAKGGLIIALSPQIEPYLLSLSSYYTQYKQKEIGYFTSFYALRLYEIIKMCDDSHYHKQQKFKFTVDHLREVLLDELNKKKYKQFAHFRERIIEQAVTQINDNPEIKFGIETEYIRTGRNISHVVFTKINKETNTKSVIKQEDT